MNYLSNINYDISCIVKSRIETSSVNLLTGLWVVS